MDDEERLELEHLLTQLADATARRTVLLNEVQELGARLPEIRAAFGNPFFYSPSENVDESIAHYTGASSHKVVLPTALALRRIDREIARIKERLRQVVR